MDNWGTGGYSFETDKGGDKYPRPAAADVQSDDELAAFEAECARTLEQERERRARDGTKAAVKPAAKEIPADSVLPKKQEKPKAKTEPAKTAPEKSVSAQSGSSQKDELAMIMRAESDASKRHKQAEKVSSPEAAVQAAPAPARDKKAEKQEKKAAKAARKEELRESAGDEESGGQPAEIPEWLRMLFTLLLLTTGLIGIYVMITLEKRSYIMGPLCFMEISVCLLTALGMNAARIPLPFGREMVMRLTAFTLMAFYCVYAADELFLKNLLTDGIRTDGVVKYAGNHFNSDIVGGLSSMSPDGMLSCAIFIAPFAFMLLMLFSPFRNVMLYVLTISVAAFAGGILRILTMSGGFSLAQVCMTLAGAAVTYIFFKLPPLQNIMTAAGLIIWDEDDDEY